MLDFTHVDVFSGVPFAGNSLAVFLDPPELSSAQLLAITQELRHFETIFVRREAPGAVSARIFDLQTELGFAGHPLLGAAAVLHGLEPDQGRWSFRLAARTVQVTTAGTSAGPVAAELDQGAPEPLLLSRQPDRAEVAAAVGLDVDDLDPELPVDLLSTGLRYLVVPVRPGALARARLTHPDIAGWLAGLGAQFCYLLDARSLEGRHWDNDGVTEDVATGSAAGCVAAYLLRHGRVASGEPLELAQGRFLGRPSRMRITAFGRADAIDRVTVAGEVSRVATGRLVTAPA